MEHTVSGVGVLDKSVSVLRSLEAGPRTLTELQRVTGLPRATAHRLAVALEAHHLVRRDEEGRFTLGFGLVALGRAAVEALPLGQLARPALERLRDRTGESAQLYVRDGDRRVCVESLESPNELRTIVAVGAVLPLDRGSAGKIFRMADGVAERGWAESVAERAAGVASVSAPVRGPGGEVLAAVGVSGPIERTTREPGRLYATAVLEAASALEAVLNGRP